MLHYCNLLERVNEIRYANPVHPLQREVMRQNIHLNGYPNDHNIRGNLGDVLIVTLEIMLMIKTLVDIVVIIRIIWVVTR